MDKFKIDSHKLIYHISRVNDWLKGKNIFPIYLEISTSGACNHRCTYCALDFMGYQSRFLSADVLKKRIFEMSSLGVKSVMYAGEGEPLLHRDIADIIGHTKRAGIDVAITTNGVLLNKDLVDYSLSNISWIKVSINGANKKTYGEIHRCGSSDFGRVIENMSYAAVIRRKKKYACVLGMQILLLPENAGEVIDLAKVARDIGMDYLVVKPYSQHPFSKTVRYKNIKYEKYLRLSQRLKKINNDKFSVVFRINTMKKWDEGFRNYRHCYGLPFWAYLDSGGNIWGCSAYLGKKEFLCGNIYQNTFKEIWMSPKRLKMVRMAKESLHTTACRLNCRMDEINRYLWDLVHPPAHVNFI